MGALTSMKQYQDEIATDIALGYVYELCKICNELPEITSNCDIRLSMDVDISSGNLVYHLGGRLGDMIKNPDVKISIVPDLLRGLRRGVKEYKRHVKNLPDTATIEDIARKNYITTRLLGIGNKYKE